MEEGWYVVNSDVDITGQIEVSGNVNLILTDGNTLTVTNNSDVAIWGSSGSSLTIYGQSSGTGTLTAISEGYALQSDSLTINGGNVNADGNLLGIYSEKDLTINGGTVNATGEYYVGIYVDEGNLTVNGGNLTAVCTNNGNDYGTAYGIWLFDGDMTITDGKVTARGNNDGIYTEGNVTISGGTVIANGGESEDASAGIYAFRGNIEITGGIVEASSGNNGIIASIDIKISGGTVNANGGYDGIWASGNLTISGGRVTAGGEQHGLYAADDVTISGGTVEATATGTEEGFYGIQADSGVVTIGEEVDSLTVSGGNKAIGSSVKNAVAGTGWTDAKGTEGQANIKVSTEGQTLDDYRKVQFPAAESPAKIDISKGTVTVNVSAKTVTVTVDGKVVPADAYHVIYFYYQSINGGESLTRYGTDFPTTPSTYIAAVVANDGSDYTGENRSKPFAISGSSYTPTAAATTTTTTKTETTPDTTKYNITGEQDEINASALKWDAIPNASAYALYIKVDGKYVFVQKLGNTTNADIVLGSNGKYYVSTGSDYTIYEYNKNTKKFDKTGTLKASRIESIVKANNVTEDFMVKYTKNGKESSEKDSYKVSVKIYYKPAVKATANKGSITLKWNKVPDASKYRVYKYVNGKLKLVTETTSRSVKITGTKAGKKYTYAVKAYVDGKWTKVYTSDLATVTAK